VKNWNYIGSLEVIIMDRLIAVTFALYVITMFVYLIMDAFPFLETAISPVNHWIPEVFTIYLIGMVCAKFCSKMVRNISIINLVVWQIFTITFIPCLGILTIIPFGFLTLLLAMFYLGYRKGDGVGNTKERGYKRIIRALILGKLKHSTGKKIRANEELLKLVVRWAETDRPAAVEEELHRRYRAKFGELPKYTKIT
jgi:hypothetical protein